MNGGIPWIAQLAPFLVICWCAASIVAKPYFETSWNYATGSGAGALCDGGKWDMAKTPSIMEVATGGLFGNNLLSVWLDGENWGGACKFNVPTNTGSDFYYRFYVRVHAPIGFGYAYMHGLAESNTGGGDANFYMGIYEVSTNAWSAYFATYYSQPEGMDQYFVSPKTFAFEQWFRIEGHVHWVNHSAIAPTQYEIRIYDINNALVCAPKDLMGTTSGKSLQSFYDAGKRYYQAGNVTSWKMGNNGPASATGSKGKMYDLCCVAFANDNWIGPFTGFPGDSLPPMANSFFPAPNASGISPGAIIRFHIIDSSAVMPGCGMGVDSASIVMTVNGTAVPRLISGLPQDYMVSYRPTQNFSAGQVIRITIDASDLKGNAMKRVSYSFTIAAGTPITPVLLSPEGPFLSMRPASSGVHFELDLPTPGDFSLKIFDVSGKELWQRVQKANMAGSQDVYCNAVSWNAPFLVALQQGRTRTIWRLLPLE